jgi:hypothetical protein
MPRKKRSSKTRLEKVNIRVERREEVDWDKFAWALLQHVRLTSTGNSTKPTRGKPRSSKP